MVTGANRMSRSAEGRDPGDVIEKLVGVGNPSLRQIAGAAQRSESTTDADRGQTRILRVLSAIVDANQGLSVRANENLGGVQTDVLHGNLCLVTREAETEFVQQAGSK